MKALNSLKNTVLKVLSVVILVIFIILGYFNLNTVHAESFNHKPTGTIVHKVAIEYRPVSK